MFQGFFIFIPFYKSGFQHGLIALAEALLFLPRKYISRL
jgi:hypothetical protein